jgi:hypothetical protein
MKCMSFVLIGILTLGFGCSFSFANQADLLCNRVNEIKILPFKGEHVDDKVYNGLIDAGKEAAFCLVKKITDTTIMPDPRKAPSFEGITVGDVALFVIVDITKTDFEEMLPVEVKKAYQRDGVYAYFKYVEQPGNRKIIQNYAYKAIEKMEK